MVKEVYGTVLYYSDQAGMHRLLRLDDGTGILINIEYGLSPYLISQLEDKGIIIKCSGLKQINQKKYYTLRNVALQSTDEIINHIA